jgi:hypothetical protein
MKRPLLLIITILLISVATSNIQAQAFDKGTKLITVALGPSAMEHFTTGNNPFNAYGFTNTQTHYIDISGELIAQGEFGIHKYVGVGFVVGIGGKAVNHEFNMPIGVLANFHFFQLIADKNGLALGNKLDVYGGITAGSGFAVHPYNDGFNNTWTEALFYLGPHAGANYYFAKNMAAHAEVGWGATVFQAGITFKLGGGKGK